MGSLTLIRSIKYVRSLLYQNVSEPILETFLVCFMELAHILTKYFDCLKKLTDFF
jgi:hypothetical protein